MRDLEPHDAQKKLEVCSRKHGLLFQSSPGTQNTFATMSGRWFQYQKGDLPNLSSPDSPFRASHRMAVLSLTDVMTSISVEGLLVLPCFFDWINLKFLKDSRLRNLLIVDVWFVFAFHAAQISLWQPLFFVPYRHVTTQLQLLQNKNC